MTEVKKYELPTPESVAFLREELRGRSTFSKFLRNQFNGQAGQAFTYMPERILTDSLLSFKDGGKTESKSEHLIAPDDKQVYGEAIPSTDWKLRNEMESFLRQHETGFILVEDILSSPKDKFLQECRNVIFSKNEVYHFLTYDDVIWNRMNKTIGQSQTAGGFVGGMILPRTPIQLSDRQQLTAKQLEQFASDCCCIFVSAYDLEGWVYWEKQAT